MGTAHGASSAIRGNVFGIKEKLERVAGIEPALEAWEASAVPNFPQKSEIFAQNIAERFMN